MGRTITYDSEIQANLDDIFKTKIEHAGLIVGQRTSQKDIAIRLCPVPPKEDNQPNADEKSKESPPKKKSEEKSPKSKIEHKNELDERWISTYSKEVTRTLPGGFEVLGVYIAAPSDCGSKLHSKLREVLFAVSEALNKDKKLSICTDVKDSVLLHICTDTMKFICRSYDVSDIKSTPNPAEWKYFPGVVKWHALQSQLAVDIKFAIKSEDSNLSVKGQIDSSLAPFFASVQNALALVNGVLRDLEEMLDPSAEGKKSKKQQNQSQDNHCIDLLFQLEPSKNNIRSLTSERIMMLTFKGNIQCRAFVQSKAFVKEAVQAIKQDIIRSITARCEIHCEDLLVIDEESQDPVVVYELPKRVFAPLPQQNLLVCDYQFHGDLAGDSLSAFKELLNLDLHEQDIQTSCEVSPATSTLIQPEVMEDRLSEFGDNPPPKKNMFFPVASAAVAAVAAGLSYFLLLQDT